MYYKATMRLRVKYLVIIMIMYLLLFTWVPLLQVRAESHHKKPIRSFIKIQGILYCTFNGQPGPKGNATRVFPGADVKLRCGEEVVLSTRTNGEGEFQILVDPLQILLLPLLTKCDLFVPTRLGTCDATLPSTGALVSTLVFVVISVLKDLLITILAPAGFHYVPSSLYN